LSIGSGDSVLKRVTIVAARPDATVVYLQAEYDSAAKSSPGAAQSSVDAAALGTVVATIPKSSALAPVSPQALSRGVGLYASMQRILSEAPAAIHIDVHA
jgi:hypothetical protein